MGPATRHVRIASGLDIPSRETPGHGPSPRRITSPARSGTTAAQSLPTPPKKRTKAVLLRLGRADSLLSERVDRREVVLEVLRKRKESAGSACTERTQSPPGTLPG